MTPNEAAKVIGCTSGQVRTLIRTGKLAAKRVPYVGNQHGYRYTISTKEAKRYKRAKQTGGWPRGLARN